MSFRIGDGNVSFGLHIGAHHRGHHHVHRCVPGHYETRATQVLVAPARCERRWVPPVFVTRYDHCGRPYTVKVRDGYYHTINIPARYETRYTKVWVPGSCDNGCSHRSHPVFDRHPGHGRY